MNWRMLAFWAVIVLGAAVRLAALGDVPAGLNADEASSGVDALSLIKTGMDRWGNAWPVWFPAWGSGMNALYTYIAIPVIAAFGLNVTTLRAIGAVFGVLMLPAVYQATRLYFGRDAALLTMALLAFLPWHVMASRWALDSNLLPFFFTLGLYTLGEAVQVGESPGSGRFWPIVAFLPWAIAIYAYPVSLIPIALSTAAILVLFRAALRRNLGFWLAGFVLAALIDLPFLLFLAKNQLHMGRLPFEGLLPFSIPVLPTSRLSQIHQPVVATIFDNLTFIVNGYRDGAVWHQSAYFPPLTGAAPFLTVIGIIALAWRQFRARRPHIVLIVLATAIAPICLLPLQLTRFNWFYIPSLMVVADLIVWIGTIKTASTLKSAAIWGATLYGVGFIGLFFPYYFMNYNNEIASLDTNLGNGFRVGLEPALRAEIAAARPDEPALVEVGDVHPYLYVLFYGLADIRTFQATRRVRVEDGVYRVSGFGRFVFERGALRQGQDFVFVGRSNNLPCADPEIIETGSLWTVGRCAGSSS